VKVPKELGETHEYEILHDEGAKHPSVGRYKVTRNHDGTVDAEVEHLHDHRDHHLLAEALQEASGASTLSRQALAQLQELREQGQLKEKIKAKTKLSPDGTIKKEKVKAKFRIGKSSHAGETTGGLAEQKKEAAEGDMTQPSACGASKSKQPSQAFMKQSPLAPLQVDQYPKGSKEYWKARATLAEEELKRDRQADPQSEAARFGGPDTTGSSRMNATDPDFQGKVSMKGGATTDVAKKRNNTNNSTRPKMSETTESLPSKTSLGGKQKTIIKLISKHDADDQHQTMHRDLMESMHASEYTAEPFISETLTGLSKAALQHNVRHTVVQLKRQPADKATRLHLEHLLASDVAVADYIHAHYQRLGKLIPHHPHFVQALMRAVSGASVHCSARHACAASQKLLVQLMEEPGCDVACQQMSIGNIAHVAYKEDLSPQMEDFLATHGDDPNSQHWGVSNLVVGALVNKLHDHPKLQHWITSLHGKLKRCADDDQRTQTVLRAMGNAGHHSIIDAVLPYTTYKHSAQKRHVAEDSLRKIPERSLRDYALTRKPHAHAAMQFLIRKKSKYTQELRRTMTLWKAQGLLGESEIEKELASCGSFLSSVECKANGNKAWKYTMGGSSFNVGLNAGMSYAAIAKMGIDGTEIRADGAAEGSMTASVFGSKKDVLVGDVKAEAGLLPAGKVGASASIKVLGSTVWEKTWDATSAYMNKKATDARNSPVGSKITAASNAASSMKSTLDSILVINPEGGCGNSLQNQVPMWSKEQTFLSLSACQGIPGLCMQYSIAVQGDIGLYRAFEIQVCDSEESALERDDTRVGDSQQSGPIPMLVAGAVARGGVKVSGSISINLLLVSASGTVTVNLISTDVTAAMSIGLVGNKQIGGDLKALILQQALSGTITASARVLFWSWDWLIYHWKGISRPANGKPGVILHYRVTGEGSTKVATGEMKFSNGAKDYTNCAGKGNTFCTSNKCAWAGKEEKCRPSDGFALHEPCYYKEDCNLMYEGGALGCFNGRCQKYRQDYDSCSNHGDCISNNCGWTGPSQAAACVPKAGFATGRGCYYSSNCQSTYCKNHKCFSKRGSYKACDSNTDCTSGYCSYAGNYGNCGNSNGWCKCRPASGFGANYGCYWSNDCSSASCASNKCFSKMNDYTGCGQHWECKSGYCKYASSSSSKCRPAGGFGHGKGCYYSGDCSTGDCTSGKCGDRRRRSWRI